VNTSQESLPSFLTKDSDEELVGIHSPLPSRAGRGETQHRNPGGQPLHQDAPRICYLSHLSHMSRRLVAENTRAVAPPKSAIFPINASPNAQFCRKLSSIYAVFFARDHSVSRAGRDTITGLRLRECLVAPRPKPLTCDKCDRRVTEFAL
jgi:hypothetical protein